MTQLPVTQQPGTALVSVDDQWAAYAQQQAQFIPTVGGDFLSIRGGMFSLGDDTLGTQICVVITDAVMENTYYTGKYQEGVQNAPKCYAFGREEKEMGPHITMADHPRFFVPQAAGCAGCQHNVWGSAEQGKGKRCQNRWRLAVIPGGIYGPQGLQLFNDPNHFQTEDILSLKVPVTSGTNWKKYVASVRQAVSRPTFGVYTRMHLTPDKKDQYHLNFEMVDLLPNDLMLPIVNRAQNSEDTLVRGYMPPDEFQGNNPGHPDPR